MNIYKTNNIAITYMKQILQEMQEETETLLTETLTQTRQVK